MQGMPGERGSAGLPGVKGERVSLAHHPLICPTSRRTCSVTADQRQSKMCRRQEKDLWHQPDEIRLDGPTEEADLCTVH